MQILHRCNRRIRRVQFMMNCTRQFLSRVVKTPKTLISCAFGAFPLMIEWFRSILSPLFPYARFPVWVTVWVRALIFRFTSARRSKLHRCNRRIISHSQSFAYTLYRPILYAQKIGCRDCSQKVFCLDPLQLFKHRFRKDPKKHSSCRSLNAIHRKPG